MAYHVRKLRGDIAFAVGAAMKKLLKDINLALATPKVHVDVTSKPAGGSFSDPTAPSALTVTAANGDGTLATLLLIANDIKRVYEAHLADDNAHKIADPAPALVAATDLTTAQTLLNAIKADYGTHIASTTYHGAADATNTIVAADATNQATADTLANELKTDLNAHMATALTNSGIKLVGP